MRSIIFTLINFFVISHFSFAAENTCQTHFAEGVFKEQEKVINFVVNPEAESEISFEVPDFKNHPVAKMQGPAFLIKFQRKTVCSSGCIIKILSIEKEFKDLDYETNPFSSFSLMHEGKELCLF